MTRRARVFGMRLRFRKIGFCFGLFTATTFAVWLSLSNPSPYESEGAAFRAVGAATALGFPVSLPFSLVLEWLGPAMEYIPGVNVLHGMLIGIVLNWTVIGLAADIWRSKGHSNNDGRPPD